MMKSKKKQCLTKMAIASIILLSLGSNDVKAIEDTDISTNLGKNLNVETDSSIINIGSRTATRWKLYGHEQ